MESWEFKEKARDEKRKKSKQLSHVHVIHRFTQMSAQENSETPQVKLMHGWGQGFVERDVNVIAKHLHKDYSHIRYPLSLGFPEENRERYLEHMREIIGLWTSNEVRHQVLLPSCPATSLPQSTIHSIIEAPGKVVVHVRIPSSLRLTAAATNGEAYP